MSTHCSYTWFSSSLVWDISWSSFIIFIELLLAILVSVVSCSSNVLHNNLCTHKSGREIAIYSPSTILHVLHLSPYFINLTKLRVVMFSDVPSVQQVWKGLSLYYYKAILEYNFCGGILMYLALGKFGAETKKLVAHQTFLLFKSLSAECSSQAFLYTWCRQTGCCCLYLLQL